MKKAILLIVIMFIAALTQVLAQPGNRMGFNTPGIQQLLIQYDDELQLTDAQKNELIALQIEHRQQFRAYNRTAMRGNRGNFRGRRNNNWQGQQCRCFRAQGRGSWGQGIEARLEMRQDVLNVLTETQVEQLQELMIDRAEKAHEFRTLRHEYIVNESGLEGEKAGQVTGLLNSNSTDLLQMARERIMNPGELNRDLRADHFQKMRDTDDQLRNILTVDEYENLRQYLGFGFGQRDPRNVGRGMRMWNR